MSPWREPSGFTSAQGWKVLSNQARKAPVVVSVCARAEAHTGFQCAWRSRLRQLATKAVKAAEGSSALQPGRSFQSAA